MTDISKAARTLSKLRKNNVGGFKNVKKAKEASLKGVEARRKKREQANKKVDDLKF